VEVFIGDRGGAEISGLVAELKALGLRGRDAAYLASIDPYGSVDPEVRANYLREFKVMVGADQRAAAARLVGLQEW
jgi:hypothetical protein